SGPRPGGFFRAGRRRPSTSPMASLWLLGDRRSGCPDFPLHGVEVEARALLHRRKLDGRHGELLHLLLDEDETPELVFEPIEILLRTEFGAAVGPARAFERVEAQVDQVRYVRLRLVTHPTARLVDEAILEVADAHGAELAFP